MKLVSIYHAAILPHAGRFCLWVQSPNKTWMLLSGHWLTEKGARSFARRAGFFVTEDLERALAAIERQMELRMLDEIPKHVLAH